MTVVKTQNARERVRAATMLAVIVAMLEAPVETKPSARRGKEMLV